MKSATPLLLFGSALQAFALSVDHQKPLTSSETAAPPYRDSLLSLHKSLIDIPSVTYSGREDAAAHFLADYLSHRGYATKLQAIPPRHDAGANQTRYNVLAWPAARSVFDPLRSRKPRVLVSSHIDVVPPFIPYSISPSTGPVTGDTVIHGRGSVDAKGSVAAQITAVEELLANGEVNAEDIMLLYVAGEETTGDGMQFFSKAKRELDPDAEFEAAVFGEPTGNKLACGHKGISGGWLYAKGKAGHSGYPELGKSATELLMRALVKALDTDLGSSERYGNTTVNVGRLEGGVAGNVIAADAKALLTVRIAAGNYSTGFEIMRERFEKILHDTDDEAFTMEWNYSYGPVECNCDVEGFETIVVNYGTDVSNLKGKHTSYLYGPGTILVAHGDNEALKVRDLEEAVEGVKRIIKYALSQ
ncbi:hypothetical protein OQA88_1347 [Cercophora sp. LCS_1]